MLNCFQPKAYKEKDQVETQVKLLKTGFQTRVNSDLMEWCVCRREGCIQTQQEELVLWLSSDVCAGQKGQHMYHNPVPVLSFLNTFSVLFPSKCKERLKFPWKCLLSSNEQSFYYKETNSPFKFCHYFFPSIQHSNSIVIYVIKCSHQLV